MTLFRRPAARVLMLLALGAAVAGVLLMSGCRKKDEVFIDTNLAPDTRLTSAPGPLDQANYRVHMYWEGSDPDGYVNGYFYTWDDTTGTAWEFTSRTDSLFKAVIDTAGETRRHTFYVRSVDNEGKLDPSPARIRFDAWTVVPVIDSLRRIPNPGEDPIDPTVGDTILMGSPATFVWDGYDPDGMGAPVEFSYRLDSNPFSPWSSDTTVTYPVPPDTAISDGIHFFYVKAKDETGAENFPENHKFVMNYSPDCQIKEPEEESGTLTVADGDTIWFRWSTRDREEIEDAGGGIVDVFIRLDNTRLIRRDPADTAFFFTSSVPEEGEFADNYIESFNNPTGGNRSHTFEVFARDVHGRLERPSDDPEDRETYTFWYNFPPTTEIVDPQPMDTVACWSWADSTLSNPFTIEWEGTDVDGEIETYQYVFDPGVWGWKTENVSSITFPNEDLPLVPADGPLPYTPGMYEFRVRARDESGCWEQTYKTIQIYIGECD